MVRRRSTVRFRMGALESAPILGVGRRVRRRGSSGGQSTRLIIVVSRVQVPPPLPRRPDDRPPRTTEQQPVPDTSSTLKTRNEAQRGSKERRHPAHHHLGVHRVQGAQLRHPQEPPQRPGSHGAEEVLPTLPLPPGAPRDPLSLRSPTFVGVRRPRPAFRLMAPGGSCVSGMRRPEKLCQIPGHKTVQRHYDRGAPLILAQGSASGPNGRVRWGDPLSCRWLSLSGSRP